MRGLRGGKVALLLASGSALIVGCGGSPTAARHETTTNPQFYANFTPHTPNPVGTDQAFTSGKPYKNPCSLATEAEVGGIVGQVVVSSASSTGSACDYRSADKLRVYTVGVPPVADPHSAYDVFKPGSVPVTGVGDQAYCSAPGRVVTLYILKGKHLIEVTGSDCAQDQKLAAKVLPRA